MNMYAQSLNPNLQMLKPYIVVLSVTQHAFFVALVIYKQVYGFTFYWFSSSQFCAQESKKPNKKLKQKTFLSES